MPTAKGIICSLNIEGQDSSSPEYDSQTEGDFASAFVIAEEHKRFSVDVATTAWIHSDLSIFVYIDGVYQSGVIWKRLSPESFLKKKNFNGKLEADKENNTSFEKAWMFDKLAVVDERAANCETDFQVLSNLGTIEVVVVRCSPAGDRPHQLPHSLDPHPHSKPYWKSWAKDRKRDAEKPSPQLVFEKDIKGRGISHRVVTKSERQIKDVVTARPNPIDSFENPYCILVMRYRSRGALQNLGLIPSTPTPSPPTSRASSPDITQDDLEQMKRLSKEDMMRELLKYRKHESAKSARKVKQERCEADEGDRGNKRARRDTEKVVIDLTDD